MGLAPAVNRATYKTPLDVLLPTISARSVGLLLVMLLVAGLQLTGCGSRLGSGTSSGPDAQWTRAQAAARAPELSAGYFEWRALDPQTGAGREAQARLAQAQEHYQHALQLLQKGQPGTRETLLRGKALAPMNPALFLPLARALHAQENDFLAMQFYRSYLRSLPDSVDAAVAAQELKALESELTALSPDSMVTASFPRTPWWRTAAAGLIGIVLLAGLVLLLRNRSFWQRGVSLAQVALQSPELQPALAYLIGTLRHELLKHRIGAASQLVRSMASQKHSPSEEQRRFLHQRLFGGTPLAQAWKEHLQGFGRALGAGHQLVRSDADFAAANRAVASLVRSESPLLRGQAGVLLTIAKAEEALLVFDERLAALVTQLQRTVLDASLLREAIAAVRSEAAASQVMLDELLLLPPPERIEVAVCQTDLLLVIKNLLRNAITAVGKSPLPHRIAIDVVLQLLPTGEELVRLRVHDTAESVLSLEQLTERSALGQRGLDLVRTTLRLYGGALALDAGLPGYTKCVVAQLFRVLAAEAATSADSQAEENADA